MMWRMVLAFPFRLAGDSVATVTDDRDQLVALLATTRRGERPLVPAYGVSDPVFGSIDVAELNAGLAMFGPSVQITGIAEEIVDDRTVSTVISYTEQ